MKFRLFIFLKFLKNRTVCFFLIFFITSFCLFFEKLEAKKEKNYEYYSYEKFSQDPNSLKYKKYSGPKIILQDPSKNISKSMIQNLINKNFENSKNFNESDVNKLLLLLYETNLFHDIKIDYIDGDLYIELQENKIIRRFEIVGDKELKKDKDLNQIIDLKPGQVFDEYQFNLALKRIAQFYKNIGYFNVKIEKSFEIQPNTKFLDIKLKIVKGQTPKISEIIFVGNKKISSEKLKKEVIFRESGILRIFSKKTKFNQFVTKLNNEGIEKFYKRNGFLDYRLLNQETIFDPRRNEIKLIFEIDEGRQFVVQDIKIETDFLLGSDVVKLINDSKGKIFNQMKFENDVKMIKKILSKNQINADVLFSYEDSSDLQEKKSGNIKLIYKIVNAQNVFIDNITILGNGRTKDSVVRNQITIHEGDLFTMDSLETSYRRISNLGFFESVNLDYKRSKNNPEMMDIFIELEEKKTGEIHLGGGYSSVNGFFAEATLHENNILGTGNILGFGIQKGGNHFSLSGSYFQNNILNTILGAGLSSFYDDYRNEKLHYDNRDYGGSLSTSIPLYEDLYLKFRYLLTFNKIYNVGINASETLKRQPKKTNASSLMYQFIYDKRDLIEYPTSGYYLNFSQNFNGLGGDKHFVSTELSTRFYKTLFHLNEIKSNKNAVVFQLKNNFGVINPYNNYILRIEDRFFFSEFRGFRQLSGISPRDNEKKPIGGDKYFFGSAQIETPVNLIQDFDLKAHIFVDYGKISADQTNIFSEEDILSGRGGILNSNKIRVSAGIGLYMITPIAPIQIAFGVPIRRDEKLDHRKYIYFSMNKRI